MQQPPNENIDLACSDKSKTNPAGIEPTTFGSEVQRANPLRYGSRSVAVMKLQWMPNCLNLPTIIIARFQQAHGLLLASAQKVLLASMQ